MTGRHDNDLRTDLFCLYSEIRQPIGGFFPKVTTNETIKGEIDASKVKGSVTPKSTLEPLEPYEI